VGVPVADDRDRSSVSTDRIVTVPNLLSLLRLVLVGVFWWLLFADGGSPVRDLWAAGVLVVSGVTDYLDGFIARRFDQVSSLGQLLDPLVDRITIAAVLFGLALRDVIGWWVVIVLLARELVLLMLLPTLRRRGLSALPVHYLGKAATFVLFAGFPLLLAGTGDAVWQTWSLVFGWAFVIWGIALYWYSAALYLEQTVRIARLTPVASMASSPDTQSSDEGRP
jgi:cardiolipin synthase (CMP-forming)